MADNIDLIAEATSARLEVLSQKLEDIKKKYQEGKISAEEYAAATKKINDEQTKLTTSVEDANAALDEQKDKISENTEAVSKQNEKVSEYNASWADVGASANVSLGIISASLKETNPALAASLGSVQKLIPNMTKLGDATTKLGGGMKGFLKAATGPAGILLLINLITTLITDFDNIATSIGLSSEQIDKFKTTAQEVFSKVIRILAGVGNAILNYVTSPFKAIVAAFKKAIKGDFKGAAEELANGIKNQFSFGKAFQAGEEFADGVAEGIASNKSKAKAKNKAAELAAAAEESFKNALTYSATYAYESFKSQADEMKRVLKEKLDSKEITQDVYNEAVAGIDEAVQEAYEKTTEYSKEIRERLGEPIESLKPIVGSVTTSVNSGLSKTEKHVETLKEKFDKLKEKIVELNPTIQDYASNFAEAAGSIGSAIQANLDLQLKQGNITQEEYNKRFEAVKKYQYAQTVINGLAAGVAIMADGSTPLVAKIAAGVALAGQVAASLSQIAATNLDSNGTMTATQKANVTYTQPYQQTYVLNGSSASDIGSAVAGVLNNVQTVLVVDDLNKVQSRQRRVVTNSSF